MTKSKEAWLVYDSPSYLEIRIIKGIVTYDIQHGYIDGYCVRKDKIWATEGEARSEAFRVIKAKMDKLLQEIEELNVIAESIQTLWPNW